jgi:hypothetical protein
MPQQRGRFCFQIDMTTKRPRMLQPKHIAIGLIAVSLSGCGMYGMFDQGTTASFNSTDDSNRPAAWRSVEEAPEPPAPVAQAPATTSVANTVAAPDPSTTKSSPQVNSLFARASEGRLEADPTPPPPATLAVAKPMAKPVTLASTSPATAPVEPPPAVEPIKIEPHGRAYLFRGVAGLIYSRGMDRLAERINGAGVPAMVTTYMLWRGVADQAIRDYRRDPQPVIIIGHSMGGDSAVAFAETLNAVDIPVSLLVTYDPTRISDNVPPNVERYINLFQSHNVMGGGDVVQGRGFHGHYASYNLWEHRELVHINIEKAERLHEQLVTKVAQLAQTPAKEEGEALPLRFVVPPSASIELWDSGMPVFAHAGDTLQTIAATYQVPQWSLEEINRVTDHTPLTEGQRIVVPRHLVPMSTAVSSYAPGGR